MCDKTYNVRRSALLWSQVRRQAPSAYSAATSLRDVRRTLVAERRALLLRPSTDAEATLRWRRLGLLLQAIDVHVRPATRRPLLEV